MHILGIELETAFLLLAVNFSIALAFFVYSHFRHGIFERWSALLTTTTFLYVGIIIALTFFPLPAVSEQFCGSSDNIRHWRLTPFASFGKAITAYQQTGIAATVVSKAFLQLFFNILLMMPLGMLLAYRYKKSFTTTLTAGLGISLLIEITQGTAIFGMYGCPYRYADVDDLITNTMGTALGYLIGICFRQNRDRRTGGCPGTQR